MKNILRISSLLLVAVMLLTVIPMNVFATSNALKGKTIVAFGDSLTALGSPTYVGYLSDLLGVDIINAGVGGNMTTHGRERFEADVLSKNPDVVLLCFGMNDQACSLPWGQPWVAPSAYKLNMSYFIEELQKIGCEVVIITPHPVYEATGYYQPPADGTYTYNYPGSLDTFCEVMRDLAHEYNCSLVDLNYEFKLLKETDLNTYKSYYGANDGIHQSQLGRQFWANKIGAHLEAVYDSNNKATVSVNCVDDNGTVFYTHKYVGANGAKIIIQPPKISSFSTTDADVKTTISNNTITFNYKSELNAAVKKVEEMDYTEYGEHVLSQIRNQYALAKALIASSKPDFERMGKCADLLGELLSAKGSVPMNLTLGKTYERPAPNYYKYEDPTKLNEIYVDDYTRLTNGVRGSVPANSSNYSAWQSDVEIIVDLGMVTNSNEYSAYFASGMWGISTPADMKISYSSDKSSWQSIDATVTTTAVVTGADGDWSTTKYTVKSASDIKARYIKFNITKNGGFVWMDEFEVLYSGKTVDKGTEIKGTDGNLYDGTQVFTKSPASLENTDNVVATFDSEKGVYVITAVGTTDTTVPEGGVIIASNENTTLKNAKAGQYLKIFGAQSDIAKYFVIRDNADDFDVEVIEEPDVSDDVANLALNKTYTISGSGVPFEYDDPTYGLLSYKADLTDGKASDSTDFNNDWFAFYKGTAIEPNTVDGIGTIVIDLEKDYDLTKIRVHLRNSEQQGIKSVKSLKVSFAKDGSETFENEVSLPLTTTDLTIYWSELKVSAVGRYVKLDFELDSLYAFLNEIEVYGKDVEESTPETPENPENPENPDTPENPEDKPSDKPTDEPTDKPGDNGSEDLPGSDKPGDEPGGDNPGNNGDNGSNNGGNSDNKDEDEEKIFLGDVNGNNEIDSMDYILLKRAYFGTFKLSEEAEKIADITKNGEIDSMDYILLKRAYFGTYTIQ